MKIEIGEYFVVRDIKALLDGAKTTEGRRYLWQKLNRAIDMSGLILLTVIRISTRKYEINEIITEDNGTVLDSGELTLTADWYDIKRFNSLVEVVYYNALFGEQTEIRLQTTLPIPTD